MFGPRTFFRGIVFFWCVFFLFLNFCFWYPTPPPENKPILLQTLSPMNCLKLFLPCSMLRVAVAKKSTQTKVMRDKVWRIISFVLLQALFRSTHTLNNTTINHNMFLFAARKITIERKTEKNIGFKEMWEPINIYKWYDNVRFLSIPDRLISVCQTIKGLD